MPRARAPRANSMPTASQVSQRAGYNVDGDTSTPLRFAVGQDVEVRISADSVPGQYIDMISSLNCEGGSWHKASVTAVKYRQDDWCPDFFCAYQVVVEGDYIDGIRAGSCVREDDDRCIRLPAAAAAPPTPEAAAAAAAAAAEPAPWDDDAAVEAAFDLYIAGLDDACGDALTDEVARCRGGERQRNALMLEKIVAAAEEALPCHPLAGMTCRVHGLESSGAQQLNGKVGRALRFIEVRDRYEVQIAGGSEEPIAVRGCNLQPARGATVTCPICMEEELDDPLGPARNGPGGGSAEVTHCCGKVICEACHSKYVDTTVYMVSRRGWLMTAGTFPIGTCSRTSAHAPGPRLSRSARSAARRPVSMTRRPARGCTRRSSSGAPRRATR